MWITTSDSPAPYPEGTRVTGHRNEVDDDDDGRERITPAGSEWRVAWVDGEDRHLVCDSTDATIIQTVVELANEWSIVS